MDIEDKYWESDIAKDSEMDKVEFVVCSEDEDTDTARSEDNIPTQTPILRTTDCTCIILHLCCQIYVNKSKQIYKKTSKKQEKKNKQTKRNELKIHQ